ATVAARHDSPGGGRRGSAAAGAKRDARATLPRVRWSGFRRRCYASPMHKCLVLACLVVSAAATGATEVYRWVDEDGVVHFSDQPHPGAEKLEVADPPTVPAYRRSTPAQRTPAQQQAPATPATAAYQSLEIVQPAAEETLWNIGGRLTVVLGLQPALQPGHRVRVHFDGTPREVPGLRFELEEVYRGAHNLQAEVVNEAGQVLIRSEPIRFYVQQTSILNRN